MAVVIRWISLIIFFVIGIGGSAFFLYLGILWIRALRKYLKKQETTRKEVCTDEQITNTFSSQMYKESENIPISLGTRLKAYRMKYGMTQEYVAQQVNVSRQAVSKWENGTSEPSTSNLVALANLFDIDVSELLK